MNWVIKEFYQLTPEELYKIVALRAEVFVVEQECVYQDLDSKDQMAQHLFLEEHATIIAYLRILPANVFYPEASIGRVLVKKEQRRAGLARQLVQKGLEYIVEQTKEQAIRISAQVYLLDFYKSLGFKPMSAIYLEDGIEHIEMLYNNEIKQQIQEK